MTPPTSQAMILPTISVTPPPETSMSGSYLKIIKDMMGKFSPAGKMSDLLTHMAEEIRKEEANPSTLPLEIPTDPTILVGTPTTQPLEEPIPISTTSPIGDSTEQNQNRENEAEVELGEEGNNREEGRYGEASEEAEDPEEETVQESVKEEDQREESNAKTGEVVVLEEDESEFEEEKLDERAMRRNLRTARKEEMVEVEGKLVKTAAKAVEEFQMAKRKRKGKQVATPSQKRKPRQASQNFVIQEPIEDLTVPPYSQAEEQESKAMETSDSEGVYEKLELEVDQKLLEAMVYFKGPKKRKDCAGR